MNENDNNPISLNQKKLKNDMLHFKDEILKDMKNMQKTIAEKFEISNSLLKEKIESYDRKINLYNEKIIQISNLVITDKDLKEKIDKLLKSKIELKDHILTNEIKLTNLQKEFQERVTKIEYVLSDSVLYPNVIGPKGKYKTFHELIDYILFQLNQNILYRERNQLDVNSYKNKLENISQSLKIQLDNIIKSTNEFTTKSVNDVEERIKGILSLYDDRFKGVRVENQNYIKNLEQFYQELKEDFKRLVNMKNNLYNRFTSEVYNMKRDNAQVVKLFGNYKKEFNLMKDRLTKLSEFIKDVRFRINVGQEVKRKEFYNMANRIDFSKKQNLDDGVSSGIKKYINGEINAEQLANSNKRMTRANIGHFGNFSNLNNNMNLDEDLNNEDSLSGINNYLMKNKNYFDPENINNNTNYNFGNKPKVRYSMVQDFGMFGAKRKSVFNSFSANNLTRQNLLNQNNLNNLYPTINNNNSNDNDFLDPNFIKPLNLEKRMAQSSENRNKQRKRYQSVFSNDKNANYQNLQIKYNVKNKNNENIESEDTKHYNDIKYKSKDNDYHRNVIKEEEESNSKLTESESIISEEQKTNTNEDVKKNFNVKDNSNNNNTSNITAMKSNQNFMFENNMNINEKLISHNKNINLNTLKNLEKEKEKEKELDNINNKKIRERNNDIINCDKNKIENKIPIIIEKEYLNNNNKKQDYNNDNNKNKNDNKKLLDEKENNNQFNGFSRTKNANINKDEKMKFSKTFVNLKSKNDKIYMDLNNNKIHNTIDGGDYKSFKGKKYNFSNMSLLNKIKEKLMPTESQINFNKKNKKNIIKIKNYSYNNNGIEFGKEDIGPKHYRNISMDEKKSDARIIQNMVNNLQSYISNYTNGMEKSIDDMYKNKNNFIYKEMDNLIYEGKMNYPNNKHKNRENVIQLKLK